MATSTAATPLLVSFSRRCPYPHCHPHRLPGKPKPKLPAPLSLSRPLAARRRDVSAAAYGGDGDMDDDFGDFDPDDADGVGEDDDVDNEQDYDVDYDRLLAPVVKQQLPPLSGPSAAAAAEEEEGDIAMVAADSFVSTRGSASDTVVDYAVDEDEFHKIRLLHCDFLIRKVPDPDHDVFDFREMYVTPPDTDIYSIPRVLAPMPQKYVRCTKKNFGRYHVSEPPVEHLRDPLYKTEREIMKEEGTKADPLTTKSTIKVLREISALLKQRNKTYTYYWLGDSSIRLDGLAHSIVFLTKHYRNRRSDDPDFFLDFEEIYIIDSKTRSITRAKIVVSVPEGKKRDRRNDLLLIRDGGESFRIIDKTKRDDAATVIQREEWAKSRQDVEKHFRKLRDFDYSNWF